MAADVGRHLGSNKRDLVTRDFLSGVVTGSKELDLDRSIPIGWERHLNLSSGQTTYTERSKSKRKLEDLNLAPAPKDELTLEVKALLPSRHPSNYQSVCTLDKVKDALERAKREMENAAGRSDGSDSKSCSDGLMEGSDSRMKMVVAGCPSCFMYVLVSKESPKCPKCESEVPDDIFEKKKKPRIDLNF